MTAFLVAWLGVMLPLVISPGPANVVFAACGAKFGLNGSFRLLAGIDSVFIIKSLLIGFGLGKLFETFPQLLVIIQVIGACYILYLAYKFVATDPTTANSQAGKMGFRQGALIQLFNAKGWLLVILMFSLFTRPAQLQFGEAAIPVLCILLAILNITCHLVWVIFGTLLETFLNTGQNARIQNMFFAFALACVSVGLLIGIKIT